MMWHEPWWHGQAIIPILLLILILAPLGPKKPVTVPRATENERSATAVTAVTAAKRFTAPRTSRAALVVSARPIGGQRIGRK